MSFWTTCLSVRSGSYWSARLSWVVALGLALVLTRVISYFFLSFWPGIPRTHTLDCYTIRSRSALLKCPLILSVGSDAAAFERRCCRVSNATGSASWSLQSRSLTFLSILSIPQSEPRVLCLLWTETSSPSTQSARTRWVSSCSRNAP
jgi:hypothetical protein